MNNQPDVIEQLAERIADQVVGRNADHPGVSIARRRISRIVAAELNVAGVGELIKAARVNIEFNGAIPAQHRAIRQLEAALARLMKLVE